MNALETKRPWIALNMVLSPRKLLLLLDHFPSAEAAWRASQTQLEAVPGFTRDAVGFVSKRHTLALDRELDEIERRKLDVLTLADERYPQALRGLKVPPPVLYVDGTLEERDQLALAVVGTRRSSAYARRVTAQLTRQLVKRGLTVVSGLALGVDSAAHRSALEASGRTLAVLGSGLARVYPVENRQLAQHVAAQGAVLSEFSLFTDPARWTFPRRNRVISGLSRGVLVVEAPRKSGALITAKAALDQGREVFAVPGCITQPNASGCHLLIQQGAKLVQNVEDILDEFPDLRALSKRLLPPPSVSRPLPPLSDAQQRVFAALSFEPRHINDLVAANALSVAELSALLVELEVLGLVGEMDNKHYVRLI